MVTVSTQSGVVEGIARPGVMSFLGLPYAVPPVGDLRWAPPQPAPQWSGTYAATRWPNRAYQAPFPEDMAPPGGIPGDLSEDMLYLNVFTPGLEGALRPVMVYIHGGGYTLGSANDFDPAPYAARAGIVVVSINYRLGIFGFCDLSRFGSRYSTSANLGFQDQIAAIKWVQDNIAAFGGDPGNITLCGCSAGGGSVVALMSAPSAKGLFRRGIAMSPLEIDASPPDVIGRCAAAVGVSDQTLFDQLRAMSGPELYDFSLKMGLGSGACVDGAVIVSDMKTAVRNGVNVTPLLIGTTLTEGGMLTEGLVKAVGRNVEIYKLLEQSMVGAIGDGDPALYTAYLDEISRSMDPEARLSRVWFDRFRSHAVRTADALARQGAPAWLYTFAVPTEHTLGPTHGSDVPFVFNSIAPENDGELRVFYRNSARVRGLAQLWSEAFIRFVRDGDPNGAGLPDWPCYGPRDRACLVLTDTADVVSDFDGARQRAAYGLAESPPH